MVTNEQVKRMRACIMKKGDNQAVAAAKAGMSEKTGRKYIKAGLLPSQMKKDRYWRSRQDPFKEVWSKIEELLSGQPGLEAVTIFNYLQREYPGKFHEGQLRTLQRRLRCWKAMYGPDKEIMFPQDVKPGVQAQSDYTPMNSLRITIRGEKFDHLLYHFMLPYSNWETGDICFSESYESLSKGFQDGLFELDAIPQEHRTDNLSAATRKIDKNGRDFTKRYLDLLNHYGIIPSKNQPGEAHENGDVEQSHNGFKRAADQALMLRGSRDFDSVEEYRMFLKEIFRRRNEPRMKKLQEELAIMRPLTVPRLEDYTEVTVPVSQNSLISVVRNIYSVKSRFIGHHLKVRVYPEYIELWFGDRVVDKIERLKGARNHKVNYRHIISSLVKKPGAFKNYRYKEDLFPTVAFRRAYDWLACHGEKADKEYVNILYLAAQYMEVQVENILIDLLKRGEQISSTAVERMLSDKKEDGPPEIFVKEPQLCEYNELLLEVAA